VVHEVGLSFVKLHGIPHFDTLFCDDFKAGVKCFGESPVFGLVVRVET
jgi:hypothetical protein